MYPLTKWQLDISVVVNHPHFSLSHLPASMSVFLAAMVLIFTMPDSAAWGGGKGDIYVNTGCNRYRKVLMVQQRCAAGGRHSVL